MSKINLKVRINNPIFIVQVLLSVFVPVLGYFGIVAEDITTWQSLFDIIKDAFSNPYVVLIMISGLWNALNDPTTKNLSDSVRAQSYSKPQ